jgi:hypothetical protein
MSWLNSLFGASNDNDNGNIVGTGDNLQEALDDYAKKVKALGPDIEITSVDVGNTDEDGVEHQWFSFRFSK